MLGPGVSVVAVTGFVGGGGSAIRSAHVRSVYCCTLVAAGRVERAVSATRCIEAGSVGSTVDAVSRLDSNCCHSGSTAAGAADVMVR